MGKLQPELTSRPRSRSKAVMLAGRIYFTLIRHLSDLLWRIRFTSGRPEANSLPFVVFEHQTPLYRQLCNVDMWMQRNKVNNLKLAVSKINGITLKPGETFSFWRAVGKPTRGKGYLEGMVLCNGTFRAETGGGLCQLSNLIYWMTLHTPLTVTERWRHTHDVFPDSNRTQPFGSGATVAYNYIDLRIKNGTDTDYQLAVWVGDSHLYGEWRAERLSSFRYRVYESSHRFTGEWWGGYMRHNVLRRRIYSEQGLFKDEVVAENHAVMMYQPMLEGG
ncbi:MAG: VanW family protein [Bacillota bacterium]